MDRLVVGISGSSGPIYGVRLLQALQGKRETHLVLSRGARLTLQHECPEWTVERVERLASVVHAPENLAASISSGSFLTAGMVVAPCSMKTLAAIASGYTDNLLSRAADVSLKERRRLILMTRETPLHLGHLRNMVSVTEMGAIVLPPLVATYHRPQTVAEVIDHTVGRVLDLLGIEHDLFRRWETPPC